MREPLPLPPIADGGARAPAGRQAITGRPITQRGARALALRLLELKSADYPALKELTDRKSILFVVAGLKRTFAKQRIAIDYAAAEGIADAVQEAIPGARDVLYTGAD